MANLYAVRQLYENVLNYGLAVDDVSLRDIKAGVRSMAHVYSPCSSDFQSKDTKFANFNDPACRCAYLHKFAPLHTYVVQDAMMKILEKVPNHFRNLLVNYSQFSICSLGGGPGSDVIGVITALLFAFGPFHSSITVVDSMKEWEYTFASIMHELTVRPFSSNFNNVWSYNNNCEWNYFECNLLCSMTNEVNKSIASASMITMVKFVSAAICTETENMVDKIFRVMKPGALVLFIDNAAGGFSQIIERSGKRNGLVPIFGPLRHVEYEVEALKIERFGYTSCFKTKVTIILMQKSMNQQNRGNLNSLPKTTGQNVTFAKSPDPVNFVLPQKRRINENTDRPPETTSKPPAFGMPQKPVSSTAIGQNRTGVNKKNNSNPSAVSNITSFPSLGLQKPSATATALTKSNVPNSARPGNGFSSVDLIQTPLIDSDEGSPCYSSGFSFERPRPTAVVAPKFPTNISPTLNRSWRSIPEQSSAVRTYQPIAGGRSQRNQPQREVDDGLEETGCSCCSIS